MIAVAFMACEQQSKTQLPIKYTPEKPEAVTNDFTLLKACLGKSQSEISDLLKQHGYTAEGNNKYTKNEYGITKEVAASGGFANMTINNESFPSQKKTFERWLKEINESACYDRLVRSSYELSTTSQNRQSFDNQKNLLAALNAVSVDDLHYASFGGNDYYANEYHISIFPRLGGVYLEVYNRRIGQPSDDFTKSDLKDTDLKKDILILKVDYLTFRYKGFYAMNISNKTEAGTEIPIVSVYQSPCDFGGISLYYGSEKNLLFDGTIVWNGCGELKFPEAFRAGYPLKKGLPYPGLDRIAYLNEGGHYVTITDEHDLQYVWQSISRQKEFQHYYGNSTKKISVYLYAPSVGVFDPSEASYFVFVEQ